MLKKCLIAIAVLALLTVTAQAFEGKIHWIYGQGDPIDWEVTLLPTEVAEFDVKLQVPYYAIIDPQIGEIVLEQSLLVDGSFSGSIEVEVSTNFEASMTCELTLLAGGISVQPDPAEWTCSVTDGNITANDPPEVQTITVTVADVDLMMSLTAFDTLDVATCALLIAPL